MHRRSLFGGLAFMRQCRRRRKRDTIGIKNRIARHASILGGAFTTPDYMHARLQWVDFCFLSGQRNVFFNATARTARLAFAERIRSIAAERSFELLPPAGDPRHWMRDNFRRRPDGCFEFTPTPDAPCVAFGGLTRGEWERAEECRLVEAGGVSVHEGWSMDTKYRHGIGLDVIIDAPALTIDVLNGFIARFRSMGEIDWRSPVGLSFRMDELPEDRLQSNLLLDPEDWPRD